MGALGSSESNFIEPEQFKQAIEAGQAFTVFDSSFGDTKEGFKEAAIPGAKYLDISNFNLPGQKYSNVFPT